MPAISLQKPGLWRIQLFGSIEVTTPSDVVVCITSKKSGELLAYLALHPGRAHSREKLVDVIWGDSEVGDARTRLRQEILTLRSLIAGTDICSSPLEITRDSCSIIRTTHVDAIRFEEACRLASREAEVTVKFGLYLSAISLYTANLLPEYDSSWIIGERVRLSQSYSRALLDLANVQRQLNDRSGAEESLNKLLKHDPVSEECHIALMRLYAELGEPTRVQQQAHAMERALRDGLGVKPTAGSLRLTEDLREAAGNRALLVSSTTSECLSISDPGKHAASFAAAQIALQRSTFSALQPSHRGPHSNHTTASKSFRLPAIVLLAMVGMAAGLFRWKALKTIHAGIAPIKSQVEFNKQSWTYIYRPRPGEKPDSEGRAILADPTTIWVTGLIQTEKDDTDILTLRLDRYGNRMWVDRYSSPEHDCDRAFSITHDGKGGVFVAGETYVPPHNKDAEGWHLVLLHYDGSGRRLWVRRSSEITRNEGACVQVESDTNGGCFIAGTALENGKQSALVLRYDATGNLRWHKTIIVGSRTVFSKLVVDPAGDLLLCGTARLGESEGSAIDDWMVARLGSDGNVKWTQLEGGPTHKGLNSAARIVLDRGGNALVGGLFRATDALPGTGQEIKLAIQKYSPDGLRIWQRVVTESGPTVGLDGLAINTLGDVIVGGTEREANGNWDISLARYDALGNLIKYCRCPKPAGYSSAALKDVSLSDDGQIVLFAEVSKTIGAEMYLHSAAVETQISPGGEVQHHWLFEPSSQSATYVSDQTVYPFLAITGQTGPAVGPRKLMVINY